MTGCGSAWLERLVWDQEVAGSSHVSRSFLFFGKRQKVSEHIFDKIIYEEEILNI